MDKLPDVLAPNLKVVFCGTQPSAQSARSRAYYAGTGNKFWLVLGALHLTPRLLDPEEYEELLKCRIGLTDLAKRSSGPDSTIKLTDCDAGRLRRSIEKYSPFALAFTSKKAAQIFFDKKRIEEYGLQSELIETTRVYVMPSTSGLGNAHWVIKPWRELANDLRNA